MASDVVAVNQEKKNKNKRNSEIKVQPSVAKKMGKGTVEEEEGEGYICEEFASNSSRCQGFCFCMGNEAERGVGSQEGCEGVTTGAS